MTNLTREEFELYEDNKRVEIDYFSRIADGRLVDVPDGAASRHRPRAGRAAHAPHLGGLPRPDQPLPETRNQAMRQLQVFLQNAIGGGDRGVIALNDGRSFRSGRA